VMGRRNAVLVGTALLLLTARSSAQTGTSSAPATGPLGFRRVPLVLGIEGGPGVYRFETTHEFGAPDALIDDPSATDSMLSLNAGLIGLLAPVRFLSFGPRLSAAPLLGASHSSGIGYTLEAALLSIFHLHPSDPIGPRPRLLIGAAWSRETLPAPKSFAIEHSISPASAPCYLVGIGFERTAKSGPWGWWLDLRYSGCRFEHEHSMLDTRTQERTTESLRVIRTSVLFTFGFGWFLGDARPVPRVDRAKIKEPGDNRSAAEHYFY
jgi:hypothetical protein